MSMPPRYALLAAGSVAILAHVVFVGFPALRVNQERYARWPMVDDAFYYLQPAWNLAHGRGLTLDGMSPTNGFHPLWMLLVVVAARFAPSKAALFDGVRAMSLVLFYATALVFASLVGAVFRRRTLGFMGLLLYLVFPHLFISHMNGLETGLALMISSLMLYSLVSGIARSQQPPNDVIRMGLLTALLFLTRTDAVAMIVPVCGFWLFWRLRDRLQLKHRLSAKGATWRVLLFCLPWAVLVSPWLIWCWARFGSIVQSSAYVDPTILSRYYATHFDYPQTGWRSLLATQTWPTFTYVVSHYNIGLKFHEFVGLVVVSCGFGLLLNEGSVRRATLTVTTVLATFLFSLIGIHVGVRLTPFNYWYYYPSQLLLLVSLLTIACAAAQPHRAGIRVAAACIVALVLIVLVTSLKEPATYLQSILRTPGDTHAQSGTGSIKLDMGGAAGNDAAIIGATDAGALAFFAPEGASVINLDGLINESAAKAIRAGRLSDYILSTPLTYLQVRAPLCFLESIMGHGFRGRFNTLSVTELDWLAKPLGRDTSERLNLLLPADSRIRPHLAGEWKYLIGEWRGVTALGHAGQGRVAVKGFGVRFTIDRPDTYVCRVALAAPFPERPPLFHAHLNGRRIEALHHTAWRSIVRWPRGPVPYPADGMITVDRWDTLVVDLGHLSAGVHGLILRNEESFSPYLLGRSNDHAIYACIVHEFLFDATQAQEVEGGHLLN